MGGKVAIYTGKIVLDDESYILYRQHSNNSSGNNYHPSIRNRIKNLLSNYRKHDSILVCNGIVE